MEEEEVKEKATRRASYVSYLITDREFESMTIRTCAVGGWET